MTTPPIEIDKNIALPPLPQTFLRLYPFPDMDVGDSFFLAGKAAERQRLRQRIRCAARRFAARRAAPDERRFTTRAVEGGVRCWRIA
ncbi:hypothetical protein [Parvibaculum sp.]|uniref:hypothetical protein n=1 Tax=Parvibaculum sp. TaxID=2024848 RepID=UPI001DBFDDFE|nr:hypothetical protein [Parvibaculum sp.]MBX3488902.1 hypothetical protein [Parvibaculum sp.]MCW5727216.1 hypothetical protein [Parvibaculum sp.]